MACHKSLGKNKSPILLVFQPVFRVAQKTEYNETKGMRPFARLEDGPKPFAIFWDFFSRGPKMEKNLYVCRAERNKSQALF